MPKVLPDLASFVRRTCILNPAESLLPFTVDSVRAGWINKAFATHLEDWGEHFAVRPRNVGFLDEGMSVEQRTATFAELCETFAAQGLIRGWRNEQITVASSFHAEPLLHAERATARWFGFTVYASHLNGLVEKSGKWHMWIARRADSKAVDPGLLDNMAAGRIGRGYGARETLDKEAWEEAGIAPERIADARPTGAVRTHYLVEEGLHHEIMFVYDLVLPADFVPRNQDGEVAGFECLPIHKILRMLETPEVFTADSAMVIIDCLIRRGFLGPERTDYLEIVHDLRP